MMTAKTHIDTLDDYKKKTGFLLSVLFLSGCTSFGKFNTTPRLPDIPEQWQSGNAVSNLPTVDWVASFEDASLKALIEEALAHNNDFLAAAANIEAARLQTKVSRAALLPTFNVNANGSRNAIVTSPTIFAQSGTGGGEAIRANDLEDQFAVDADNDGNLDGLDLDGDGIAESPLPNRRTYINDYNLGAQFSWELDLWGRLRDETNAVRKEAYATVADLSGVRLSIASAVAQNWYVLIESRLQRELAERDVAAREKNFNVTQTRTKDGASSKLDLRLAKSALGSSRANLADRQQAEGEAARRLEVLLGRYPSAQLSAAAQLPALEKLVGAGIPADLIARRPDLIAAELRLHASGLRAQAARKQLLPSITLTGQLNTNGPQLSDLIDPERLAGAFAGGLAQPIFQGGRLKANAKSQRALAEASLLSFAQTALRAYEEVENALAAETLLAIREQAFRLAFEEARAAEELTEKRYIGGAATIFNRLDAQTRRISAESAYILAQQQRVVNRIGVHVAIGGDFLTALPTFPHSKTVNFEEEKSISNSEKRDVISLGAQEKDQVTTENTNSKVRGS